LTASSTPRSVPLDETGHLPTLLACFAHFDVCFMLWVLIGALGAFIFDGTAVDTALKGLLVGMPILMGSLLRVPLGLLSDRIGGRRVGLGLLLFLVIPLALAWLAPSGLTTLVVVGLTLGAAGSSFAIVLPMASRWYPSDRQGLVMGIAAAGNSGTVLANVFAPRLANVMGWHNVFGLALVPLAAVLVLFFVAAKDAPGRPGIRTPREFVTAVAHADTAWLCFFYSVTFGGYVGLSSFLPILLRDQFAVSPVNAGLLTAMAAFAGSAARPFGGYLADRIGGVPLLQRLLVVIALVYAALAALPPFGLALVCIVVTMICLGLGNGAVFQLVPLRFSQEVGSITGVVGAVGGIGGFLLPTILGAARQSSGSYAGGFVALALLAMVAGVSLSMLRRPARRDSWAASLATAQDV
jgi:NNP family nitrate/nitrite transporter-like MFS transporter